MDNESEQWIEIPGHEDYYLISDQGRVLSLHRDTERLLKPSRGPDGYQVGLYIPDEGRKVSAYLNRLVLLAFDPIAESDRYRVIPRDRDLFNPVRANLSWQLIAGEGARHVCLREDQVREIRALYFGGSTVTQQALAVRFGVSRSAIYHIVNGSNWGHVK